MTVSPRKGGRRGTPTKGVARADHLKVLIKEIQAALKLKGAKTKKRKNTRGLPPVHQPYKKPYTPVAVAAENDTLPPDPDHPAVVSAANIANDIAEAYSRADEAEAKLDAKHAVDFKKKEELRKQARSIVVVRPHSHTHSHTHSLTHTLTHTRTHTHAHNMAPTIYIMTPTIYNIVVHNI